MEEEKLYQKKEVSVSQRQIYILSLLSENPRGYTAEDIRTRLKNWDIDVSKRTITRDIDELSLNYGIGEEDRGGNTYFYADKYTLKNVDFTIEDLASLAFAKEMLKQYEHLDMGRHVLSFIDKIVESSASLNQLQFEKLCGHFKQTDMQNSKKDIVDSKTEKLIQNAIDSQNKISVNYYSFTSDEYTQRVVHPYRLVLIDAYLCVEGYCELRGDVRRFRLSRMKNVKVLDEKYDKSEYTTLSDEKNVFLKLTGGPVEQMELIFTGESVRYVKEYEAFRATKIEQREDGLHFFKEAAIAPDVIRWIRGFGSEVQVVKPNWLKTKLLEEAKASIEKE